MDIIIHAISCSRCANIGTQTSRWKIKQTKSFPVCSCNAVQERNKTLHFTTPLDRKENNKYTYLSQGNSP